MRGIAGLAEDVTRFSRATLIHGLRQLRHLTTLSIPNIISRRWNDTGERKCLE